jgi:hypothetical protein
MAEHEHRDAREEDGERDRLAGGEDPGVDARVAEEEAADVVAAEELDAGPYSSDFIDGLASRWSEVFAVTRNAAIDVADGAAVAAREAGSGAHQRGEGAAGFALSQGAGRPRRPELPCQTVGELLARRGYAPLLRRVPCVAFRSS